MELLAVTAPEEAGKDATASQAEVEGAEKTAAMPEAESPVGKMVTPEGAAAVVVGASENPAAERVAEAFARAAERTAVAEVAKVLQSAIAEVGTPAAPGAWGVEGLAVLTPLGWAHRSRWDGRLQLQLQS